MSRSRYFRTVMPIWAVLYLIGLIVLQSSVFAVAGAIVFALLAAIGTAVLRADGAGAATSGGRQRNRKRYAK